LPSKSFLKHTIALFLKQLEQFNNETIYSLPAQFVLQNKKEYNHKKGGVLVVKNQEIGYFSRGTEKIPHF